MRKHRSGGRRERGSVLVTTLIFAISCAALAGVMVRQGFSHKAETDIRWASAQRLYMARAGLANGFLAFRSGGSGALGSSASKVNYSNGQYWTEATSNADGTTTLTSHGWYGGQSVSIKGVIYDTAKPIFNHAMLAGNSGGDMTYNMEFGGTGTQADHVTGDIYSGGNILAVGTPVLDGDLRAAGSITGTTGTTGTSQPISSLASMNYETNNNVNVATQFSTGSPTYTSNSGLGGTAWQLPQANPAHIFRKNPSDRASLNNGTAKNDYYLEDPYQTVNGSSITDAAHSTPVALSNGSGPLQGNKITYYIDGNMWVNNLNIYSFKLTHPDASGVQVTFVVKGNIYMSDNIIYQNAAKDGISLIALKDSAVADSGNIYFGDPSFGTLEEMDAYMYAENNFIDQNLSASGSAHITVKGTMAAGNQVVINRDYGSSHTRLDLIYDDRLANNTLAIPNLPPLLGGTQGHAYVISAQWGIGQ
jgi:hypothetical protein